MVWHARSQDLVVSVPRVRSVFSTVECEGGGTSCPKARETAALRWGTQKARFEPKPLVSQLKALPIEPPERPMQAWLHENWLFRSCKWLLLAVRVWMRSERFGGITYITVVSWKFRMLLVASSVAALNVATPFQLRSSATSHTSCG